MIKKWLLISFLLATIAVGTATGATLELSPSTGSYEAGDIFAVDILLDTEGIDVVGVDVILNYPPNLLEVQDEDPGTAGVQITYGTLFDMSLGKVVDPINGKIRFSQLSWLPGYTGSGTLGTIRFKALEGGTANVNFDFTPSGTGDCNVASTLYPGVDILSSVTNGRYEISNIIPEFSTIAIPVGAILGLLFFFNRRKHKKE